MHDMLVMSVAYFTRTRTFEARPLDQKGHSHLCACCLQHSCIYLFMLNTYTFVVHATSASFQADKFNCDMTTAPGALHFMICLPQTLALPAFMLS